MDTYNEHSKSNPINEIEVVLERNFDNVFEELSELDKEILENYLYYIEKKATDLENRVSYIKKNIEKYFEIKNSAFSRTLEQETELNNLEKILKL